MTDVTKFDPVAQGLKELQERYAPLVSLSDKELDAKVLLTDGLKEVKDAKKELTSIRTSIGAAHKAAKAPILEAGKALDAEKKRLEGEVKKLEDPLANALTRLKQAEEKAAAEAQAKKTADLEKQLAEAKALLDANGIGEVAFEEKAVDITITSKVQLTALEKIIGKDNVKALKFGEDGTPYVLGLLVRRKEVQEV